MTDTTPTPDNTVVVKEPSKIKTFISKNWKPVVAGAAVATAATAAVYHSFRNHEIEAELDYSSYNADESGEDATSDTPDQ